MKLTPKEVHNLEQIGAFVIIILLLMWVIAHLFGKSSSATPASDAAFQPSTFTPSPVNISSPVVSITPASYSPDATSGGSCCCNTTPGCAANPNEVPTLNSILAAGTAAANAILVYGQNTEEAIAQLGQQDNPLLRVTYN